MCKVYRKKTKTLKNIKGDLNKYVVRGSSILPKLISKFNVISIKASMEKGKHWGKFLTNSKTSPQ